MASGEWPCLGSGDATGVYGCRSCVKSYFTVCGNCNYGSRLSCHRCSGRSHPRYGLGKPHQPENSKTRRLTRRVLLLSVGSDQSSPRFIDVLVWRFSSGSMRDAKHGLSSFRGRGNCHNKGGIMTVPYSYWQRPLPFRRNSRCIPGNRPICLWKKWRRECLLPEEPFG